MVQDTWLATYGISRPTTITINGYSYRVMHRAWRHGSQGSVVWIWISRGVLYYDGLYFLRLDTSIDEFRHELSTTHTCNWSNGHIRHNIAAIREVSSGRERDALLECCALCKSPFKMGLAAENQGTMLHRNTDCRLGKMQSKSQMSAQCRHSDGKQHTGVFSHMESSRQDWQ